MTRPMLTRRSALAAAGIAVAYLTLPRLPARGQAAGGPVLRAAPAELRLRGAADPPRALWAFDGAVPGPLIRAPQGSELTVRLINELPAAVGLRWHGLAIWDAGKIVASDPQSLVAAGGIRDYRLNLRDAGLALYHTGWDHPAAVSLCGAMVVEESTPVATDRDVILFLHDWPKGAGQEVPPGLGVNGEAEATIPVSENDRVRLRVVNATRANVVRLRVENHVVRVMAIDGQPAQPFQARDGRVVLGPGNRIELFVDTTLTPGSTAPVVVEDTNGASMPIARLVSEGAARRAQPLPEPAPLPPNNLPERIDLKSSLKLDVPLVEPTLSTTLPAAPLFTVKPGSAVTLGLNNRGSAPQVVHIRGHHVRLLDRMDDGWKPFWLDTITLGIGETARVAFVADRAGPWTIETRVLEAPFLERVAWFNVS